MMTGDITGNMRSDSFLGAVVKLVKLSPKQDFSGDLEFVFDSHARIKGQELLVKILHTVLFEMNELNSAEKFRLVENLNKVKFEKNDALSIFVSSALNSESEEIRESFMNLISVQQQPELLDILKRHVEPSVRLKVLQETILDS